MATPIEPEESAVVLVCQGCRYAFEPAGSDWTPEYLRALSAGCPECGDWLYLGRIDTLARIGEPR